MAPLDGGGVAHLYASMVKSLNIPSLTRHHIDMITRRMNNFSEDYICQNFIPALVKIPSTTRWENDDYATYVNRHLRDLLLHLENHFHLVNHIGGTRHLA